MCSSTSDTFADSYLSLIFLNVWHFCSHWKPHHYLDKFLSVNEWEWTRSCSEVAWSGSFLLLLLLLLLAGVVIQCVSRSSGIRLNPIFSPVVRWQNPVPSPQVALGVPVVESDSKHSFHRVSQFPSSWQRIRFLPVLKGPSHRRCPKGPHLLSDGG